MPQPPPRFLCPHCFQFGRACHACPGCWEETGLLRARLNVGSLQACPCCYASLYVAEAVDCLAFCEHCHQLSDAQLHHDRQVRLVGVLGRASLEHVRLHLGTAATAEGPLRLASGQETTYLLDLSTTAADVNDVPASHALRHLDALWLAGAELDALELGRLVDRFVRQARLGGAQRRTLPVLIREASLPAASLNALRSRLSNLRYGVELSEVLAAERGWVVEARSPSPERPRVIATLHPGAFRTLAALLPAGRQRRLHAGITCADEQGHLTVLVDASQFSVSRRERLAPVQQAADAVWIDSLPVTESLPPFLERLGVQFGRTRAARARICLLLKDVEDEERSALLTESFPNVRWGVTPPEALATSILPSGARALRGELQI